MVKSAEVVVIGSGAFGASVAFHLVKAGIAPVVLVDKHEIASQTSPRAAGMSALVRSSDLMMGLAAMAAEKIKNFSDETGEALTYFQSGSIRVARTLQHEKQLQESVERGRTLGVDIELISPATAQALMPFFEPVDARTIAYTPGDLYFEPKQLPMGYATAAARLGGILLPNTSVIGIREENNQVAGVITDQGEIRTSIVVDSAGAWTRLIGKLVGTPIGLVPTRHQLLITNSIPGVEPHHPAIRVMDCNVYIRPCNGGLMVGGYEADPLQMDMGQMASSFAIGDLPLDFSVLEQLIGRVSDQFPILRNISVREHRGGLPTMTADGELIVGPLPEVQGFYVISGCCVSGLSIAPSIGDVVARWIMSGEPPMDLSALSPARPAVRSAAESALLEQCRRRYAYHYSTTPREDEAN